MKVSDFLKKIGSIDDAAIQIVFQESKGDADPVVEYITDDTPEESADRLIERAAGYSVQYFDFAAGMMTVYAVRIPKRESEPKREKPQRAAAEPEQVEQLKKDVQDLKDLRDSLIREVAGLVDKVAENVDKMGTMTTDVFRRARAAVARFLTRIFRIRKRGSNNGKR